MAEGAAVDSQTYVHELDGGPGDLHCMTCLKICNYPQGSYCCIKTRDMSLQNKKCESAFLMVCFQRHAIDQMVRAMIEGKKIVDTRGNCLFCRNRKAHEEDKWCSNKSMTQLYLSRLHKDEAKVDYYLEKYLQVRISNKQNDLKKVLDRISREMREYAISQGKSEEEIEHIMARQGRQNRKTQRDEIERVEEENEQIRARLAHKLLERKDETLRMLQEAESPPTLREFIERQFLPAPHQ